MVRIRRGHYGGYVVDFTISDWKYWCRQCDAEEGRPLRPLEFTSIGDHPPPSA